PQRAFTCEVMVNSRTCEVGTDRDRLKSGGVVPEFAEYFPSRLHNALTRVSRLCCGRASWSSASGMLRHGQIVPQPTRHSPNPGQLDSNRISLQQIVSRFGPAIVLKIGSASEALSN